MNDSTNTATASAGGNTPPFGGSPASTLSSRLRQASDTLGMALMALDGAQKVGVKLSDLDRAQVHGLLTDAQRLVTDLLRESRTNGRVDLDATLTHVSNTINLSMALVVALDPEGAREAMRQAQAPLLAARRAAEVAEENLEAAAASWPFPIFRPAPDMPSDAGKANVGLILGLVALIFVALFCWALSGKAEARSLDGPPVTAVKVQPAKPKPKCAEIYRVTVPVHVTTRSTADGKFHAAVWLQERYERPRFNKQTKRWEYFRARLVGVGVSDSRTVKVSGCIDPRKVDGLGGPIYLLLNDVVDDDQDAHGRIDRGTVRVRFVEGAGWKQVSK